MSPRRLGQGLGFLKDMALIHISHGSVSPNPSAGATKQMLKEAGAGWSSGPAVQGPHEFISPTTLLPQQVSLQEPGVALLKAFGPPKVQTVNPTWDLAASSGIQILLKIWAQFSGI